MRLSGIVESVLEKEFEGGGHFVEIVVRDSDSGRPVRGRFRGLPESLRVGDRRDFGVELINKEVEGVWKMYVTMWLL
jgi:hypothetical protein